MVGYFLHMLMAKMVFMLDKLDELEPFTGEENNGEQQRIYTAIGDEETQYIFTK